tara:strand:- start:1778 stop:2962 length:1185 start_codon:yes stop_codon:yes gene_type:complete
MKLQILNNIAEEGLKLLEDKKFELTSDQSNVSGIVLRSHNLQALEIDNSLHAIARAGAGTNNININNCSEKGVVVFNTPGANANAVKEMVVCALILSKRDLVSGNRNLDSLEIESMDDEEINSKIENMKKEFVGEEVRGKKLSVIGLGAIGSMVAEQAIMLGMKVQAYDPGLTVDTALGLPSSLERFDSMDSCLNGADYVSLHIPLNEKTNKIINNDKLSLLNENAVLINFSRGGIVDEQHLIEHLDSRKILKYVTDFPTKDLLKRINLKNDVIIFPHLGASTKESEINCAVMACQQISDFLEYGKIVNSVNFPNISSEKFGQHRIFITNKNEPGIISKIAECLAKNKINISEFVNKSRGNLACNIIDTDNKINNNIVCELEKIKGVSNARLCY